MATLARLVANDERFRVVLSEAPFGVVVLGADVRVQVANGVVESIMGYGPGDMDLRPLGDFCPRSVGPCSTSSSAPVSRARRSARSG